MKTRRQPHPQGSPCTNSKNTQRDRSLFCWVPRPELAWQLGRFYALNWGGGDEWKSDSPTFHLWMPVIWGQWQALYFLNPIRTENVFGLYCVTSLLYLTGPRGAGQGWLCSDGPNVFSCHLALLIAIPCFMVSFPAAPKIHCIVF